MKLAVSESTCPTQKKKKKKDPKQPTKISDHAVRRDWETVIAHQIWLGAPAKDTPGCL